MRPIDDAGSTAVKRPRRFSFYSVEFYLISSVNMNVTIFPFFQNNKLLFVEN